MEALNLLNKYLLVKYEVDKTVLLFCVTVTVVYSDTWLRLDSPCSLGTDSPVSPLGEGATTNGGRQGRACGAHVTRETRARCAGDLWGVVSSVPQPCPT